MASAFTGIDHVGIAVADLDIAVAAYERLTGTSPAHRQVVALAEHFFRIPRRPLSHDEVERQLSEWERPALPS